MKKILLAAVALATISLSATAQTRMTLHEEFTGENCGPCASTNPGFWTLCNSTTPVNNPSKLIHIAYMVPIPSTGWFTQRNTPVNSARATYYSCSSAPFGKYDGNAAIPTHPYYFTQGKIDTESAIASPFNMTVTNAWDATYDSVITTVTITCVTAFSTSSAFNLRAALVQTCDFSSPPGSNGETHFENVVQDMFPSASGTSLPTTWTVGMTQTFIVRGKAPAYVEKDKSPYMVCWLQDEADKNIKQAAKGAPLPNVPNDASISASTSPGLVCVADGPYSVAHSVTVKNRGASTLTSATIYYNIDGGTMMSQPWTGSLATGATATVTMPAATATVAGASYHYVYDSVAMPNGSADGSVGNSVAAKSFFTESTNALTMPYATSFETADLGKFYYTDANNNGRVWGAFTNSAGLGHSSSNAMSFQCYDFAAGETEVVTLPLISHSTNSELTFWVAYCQYDATTDDKLELVYSTTCGSSWTSLWNAAGSALSTAAISTSDFTPTSSQYVKKTVNVSAAPAGAIFGFRGTSDFGNNIWVDDINLHTVVSVNTVATVNVEASLYPNPARENATLSFNLTAKADVNVQILDAVGRVVSVVTDGSLTAGAHSFNINTTGLTAGVYNVMINTDGNTVTKRLSVVK